MLTTWPGLFVLLLILTWFSLMLDILSFSFFGDGVILPVIYTLLDRETWQFITFMVVFLIGVAQAYWSFPIQENLQAPQNIGGVAIFPFMKIFRLVVLQDFDLWELEGVDPVVKAQVFRNQSFEGTVDDGPVNPTLHFGIYFLFLVLVVLSVAFMNVLIGLIGNLYHEHLGCRHQIHHHFKAGLVVRYLMIQWAFPCVRGERSQWAEPLGDEALESVPDDDSDELAESMMNGCWLAFDRNQIMDVDEKSQQVANKRRKLQEMDRDLGRVVEALKLNR